MKELRPGKAVTAVTKLASERWKVISFSEKLPFQKEFEENTARYKKAMETYVPPVVEQDEEDEAESEEEDEEDEDEEEKEKEQDSLTKRKGRRERKRKKDTRTTWRHRKTKDFATIPGTWLEIKLTSHLSFVKVESVSQTLFVFVLKAPAPRPTWGTQKTTMMTFPLY